jgi:hypothetical protein
MLTRRAGRTHPAVFRRAEADEVGLMRSAVEAAVVIGYSPHVFEANLCGLNRWPGGQSTWARRDPETNN